MRVSVLGATGIIGQQFVRMLVDHPKFELAHMYASDRSEGKKLEDIWALPNFDCPVDIQNREVENIDDLDDDVDVYFSALPKSVAGPLEIELREAGKNVFSNAGSHRMDDDVPILIPEINPSHMELVKIQQENSGSDGFIITNSNCSAAGASTYLAEVDKIQTISTAIVTTYQALSGAGIGGVAALNIVGNVIPHIRNEEPKIIEETKKILGKFEDGAVTPHPMRMIANAARVNVSDGHLEAINCLFDEKPDDQIQDQLGSVLSPLELSKYHIAPETHLNVFDAPDRPQPQLDVFRSDDKPATAGMTVHAGRLRILQNDLSAYVLVHNTIRGGAGGSILNAEFALEKGYL